MENNEAPRPGRLEFLPIRHAFPNEPRQFTRWLELHIQALSERIGLDLTIVQREKQVGDFNVDLLCEDSGGSVVIVENQLERTDHDHLGKLLTYMVNLDARCAIWVSPDARAEHQHVIEWLNESTPDTLSFYLVRVEAVRIGTSPYAPLFTVLAGPNAQSKEIGENKKEWADRHYRRLDFWKSLLEGMRQRTRLFSNISPGRASWISTGAGKSGIAYTFVVWMDSAAVELYIDCGDGAQNKSIFDGLHAEKGAIEQEFGEQLEWERLDDKRASRIRKTVMGGGLEQPESWGGLQAEMIDAMIRLERSLKSRLSKSDT